MVTTVHINNPDGFIEKIAQEIHKHGDFESMKKNNPAALAGIVLENVAGDIDGFEALWSGMNPQNRQPILLKGLYQDISRGTPIVDFAAPRLSTIASILPVTNPGVSYKDFSFEHGYSSGQIVHRDNIEGDPIDWVFLMRGYSNDEIPTILVNQKKPCSGPFKPPAQGEYN